MQGLFIPLIPSAIYSNVPQQELNERFPQLTCIGGQSAAGAFFFFFLTNPNPFLLLFFCFSLAFPRNSPEVSLLGGTDRQAGALLCSRTPGD